MGVGVFGWKDSLIVVVVIRYTRMTKSVYVILSRDFFLPTDVLSHSLISHLHLQVTFMLYDKVFFQI